MHKSCRSVFTRNAPDVSLKGILGQCKSPRKRLGSARFRVNRKSRGAVASSEIYEQALGLSVRGVLDTAITVGILGSLAWSALPVIASSVESRRPEWEEKVWENQSDTGLKWGLMSVISFLPVFNWLAWIFGALQNEDRAAFYYTLAALYALPQIETGFQQDTFSLLTIAIGIAHVQIERIAEERGVLRETFQLSEEVKQKPKEASKLLEGSAKSFAEAIDTQERNSDIKAEVLQGKPTKPKGRDDSGDQLKSWDAKLKDRDR